MCLWNYTGRFGPKWMQSSWDNKPYGGSGQGCGSEGLFNPEVSVENESQISMPSRHASITSPLSALFTETLTLSAGLSEIGWLILIIIDISKEKKNNF